MGGSRGQPLEWRSTIPISPQLSYPFEDTSAPPQRPSPASSGFASSAGAVWWPPGTLIKVNRECGFAITLQTSKKPRQERNASMGRAAALCTQPSVRSPTLANRAVTPDPRTAPLARLQAARRETMSAEQEKPVGELIDWSRSAHAGHGGEEAGRRPGSPWGRRRRLPRRSPPALLLRSFADLQALTVFDLQILRQPPRRRRHRPLPRLRRGARPRARRR